MSTNEFDVGDIISTNANDTDHHLILEKFLNNSVNRQWTYTLCPFVGSSNDIKKAKDKFIKANYTNFAVYGREISSTEGWRKVTSIFDMYPDIALKDLQYKIEKEINVLTEKRDRVVKAKEGMEIYEQLVEEGVI